MSEDIRYYRGEVPLKILVIKKRKALIKYLAEGFVGPKGLKKLVSKDETDIILIRHCWRRKK